MLTLESKLKILKFRKKPFFFSLNGLGSNLWFTQVILYSKNEKTDNKFVIKLYFFSLQEAYTGGTVFPLWVFSRLQYSFHVIIGTVGGPSIYSLMSKGVITVQKLAFSTKL